MASISVTVLHGKTALTLSVTLEAANWLDALKHEVAQATGVAVAHQKLVFRGKELVARGGTNLSASLVNGSKIMLLKNKAFYDDPHAAASLHVAAGPYVHGGDQHSSYEEAVAPASTPTPGLAPPDQRIDRAMLSDEDVLVQAMRGRAVYEFICSEDASVLSVKQRVASAMGLTAPALRLILKGKTPPDTATLRTFATTTKTGGTGTGGVRVLKCMVLLDATQHELMEHSEEVRVLHNELAQLQLAVRSAERVLFKNVLPAEQALMQLRAHEERVGHARGNLQLLEDQVNTRRLAHGSETTLTALANVRRECEALAAHVDALIQRFMAGRGS